MAGLLDFVQTPEGQGLLSAAFGGLATAGRRGTGTLNTLGAAGLSGLQGYANAQDNQLRRQDQDLNNQFLGLRINQAKQQAADADALRGFDFSKFYQTPEQQAIAKYGAGDQATAAIGQFQPKFDTQGMAQAMLTSGQPALMQQGMAMLNKGIEPVKLGKGEQLVVRGADGTYTPVANNATPELKNGYIISDGKGGYKVDPELFKYEKDLKATGAPKVSVSPVIQTGTTFGKKVAEIGGEQLMGMVNEARSAPQVVNNANQILSALNTGNVLAGPGSDLKLTAAQIFGGPPEKVEATRQVIQGLANLTLASRKSLSGQGAITDKETDLLERAKSGDLNKLTAAEVRLLANGAINNAKSTYEQGRVAASALGKMPELQSILPVFQLPDLPAPVQQPQPNMPKSAIGGNGFSARRIGGQ